MILSYWYYDLCLAAGELGGAGPNLSIYVMSYYILILYYIIDIIIHAGQLVSGVDKMANALGVEKVN